MFTEQQRKDFEAVTRPVIKWLNDNCQWEHGFSTCKPKPGKTVPSTHAMEKP